MQIHGKKLLMTSMAAFLVPLGVGFAHSWGFHKASDRTTKVTLGETMKLQDGKTLPAGTYRVEVAENSQSPMVSFLRDGKVVASEQAQVVNQSSKNPYTEVDSVKHGGTQVITTIRPSGWHEILHFAKAS